jgi:hypothetical protein
MEPSQVTIPLPLYDLHFFFSFYLPRVLLNPSIYLVIVWHQRATVFSKKTPD